MSKFVNLNVAKANLASRVSNKPYRYASLCKWEEGCGDQYRWPGDFIRGFLEKHEMTQIDYLIMVNDILENKYGTDTITQQALNAYINGRSYNKQKTVYDPAKAHELLQKAIAKGANAWIEIVMDGKGSKYVLKTKTRHGICPKMDVFNACADAIEAVDNDAGSTVRMAGRAYYAMAAKKNKKKAA